ncbi:hypothetical protein ADIS_1103 [Lunatimonas lonarensis]|uniref:Uncharacterized protein n=1 Tax=Lunatimonas lonarensis TaxID=1232681 RepID=R7ZWE6_9BACT|nr:hypothetical protein [Lunatimonas lonarensis]EON78407.1 hypothetical protein ADIS_1103 [Lunatimonas lonarensis]
MSVSIAQQVEWGDELFPALFGQVEIDHGGLYLGVPEELLDGVDVGAGIEQVGGK